MKNQMHPWSDFSSEKNDTSVYGTLRTTQRVGHSLMNGINLAQNYLNDRFAKFDYGIEKNLEK